MEIKNKFSLYTEEEREALLMHWWYYYGKLMVTLAEMEEFHKMVEEDSMLMKDVALTAYLLGYSSQGLIKAMRTNDLDNFLEGIKIFTKTDEYKMVEDELEQIFLREIVGTYNVPEANVPMSDDEMARQIAEIIGEPNVVDAEVININASEVADEVRLTPEKVREVYRKCLVKDEEVKDDMPTVDFILGEGVQQLSLFSADRLEENKEEIISLIDQLPCLDRGASFLTLCDDKYGRQWTDLHSTMDLLVQLGNATGVIQFVLPRAEWDKFYGRMPEIIRNRENDGVKVQGNKPETYQKTLDEFRRKNS